METHLPKEMWKDAGVGKTKYIYEYIFKKYNNE